MTQHITNIREYSKSISTNIAYPFRFEHGSVYFRPPCFELGAELVEVVEQERDLTISGERG